jgi:YD repeat-containing protein
MMVSVNEGGNAVNVLGQANFTSGSSATAQNRMNSPRGVRLVASTSVVTTTITYAYDPLYRLTAADYAGGDYFHYAYDAVGNRLTEVTPGGSVSYTCDVARAASRSEAEGQPADGCGGCELHLVEQRQPAVRWDLDVHLRPCQPAGDIRPGRHNLRLRL